MAKLIKDKSFEFALSIVKLYKNLVNNKEFVISRQLLRAGTSIGANIVEAGASQTKKEFISKMSIASKEARETKYWLHLLKQSNLVELKFDSYLSEIEEIISMLTKIVKTSQLNLQKNKP